MIKAIQSAKRGGGAQKVALGRINSCALHDHPDLLFLDEALDALAELDTQQAKIVATAKAWLFDRLNPPQAINGKNP